MKKVILVLALVLAMLMVTACGGGNASTNGNAVVPTTSAEEVTSSSVEGDAQGGSDEEAFTIVDDLVLTKLDGTTVKLSEVSERHTIVNLWATWCTYCKKEMPHLIELAKRDDVAVVFISQRERVEDVKAYMESMGYDFDVYVDEAGIYGQQFGLRGYPHNVFLTESRGLMYQHPGYLSQEEIEKLLDAIDTFRKENNI